MDGFGSGPSYDQTSSTYYVSDGVLILLPVRWSPDMDNDAFGNQSATMFSTYHLLLILVHRPFSMPRSQAEGFESPFPSAAICLNAARSCARIVDGQRRRGFSNAPILIHSSNICAAVLMAHIWDLKAKQKAGVAADIKPPIQVTIDELIADVDIFIKALEWAAVKWEIAGQAL
jgi:hypothetical protein